MGRADYLALGDWNASCSMCGFKYKASELSRNWMGMYRCYRCQEPRQPQDYVRAVPDVQTPPWTQTIPFVALPFCYPNGRSAIPSYMTPGCALPGFVAPGNTIPYYYPSNVT